MAGGRRCSCGGRITRRPETITVIDQHTLDHGWHPDSYVDHGIDGIDLPLDVIRRRALPGTIVPVVVDADGVAVTVDGTSDGLRLGRSARLANRAQRRALRAMYRTCPIDDCTVPFDHCQPHHITWWEHGGLTDIDNLLPVCVRHHHLIHDRDWQLTLGPGRRLTTTRADGTTHHTDTPRQQRRRQEQR